MNDREHHALMMDGPFPTTKRDLILECALKLFSDRGYNGVGVEELATAAGVTKPTLYYYFGNKQGLIEALVTEQFDPFLDDLRIAATYSGDLPKTLDAVVKTVFAFGIAHSDLYWMVLAAELTASDDIATQVMSTRIAAERAILVDLFDRATADHGNITGKQRLAAETLLAMISIHLRLAAQRELVLDERANWFLIQQFSYGIYS